MKKEGKKITRRNFLKAGIAGGVFAAGLSPLSGRKVHAQVREVKIGLLAPLTGVSANWGTKTYYGFQLAADVVNESGGIKSMGGSKIKIVVADTESKPEVAGIQAEKLINDKDILILSGSNQSAASMLGTQIAERNHICFITGSDGTPQITQRGFQYTYRTCPIMTEFARDLIYFFRDMGKETGKSGKKMAVLCENSIFGVSGGDGAVKFGKEVGLDIVDYSTYDAVTARDFTGYISKYKSAGVDLLACNSRIQDAILITRTMKELDFNPLGYGGIYGAHGVAEYVEGLGKDSNYVTSSTFYAINLGEKVAKIRQFEERYRKKFNASADSNMTFGFTVLAVLQAALDKSPKYDRELVKQAVDKISLKFGDYNNLQIEGITWTPNHDNASAKAFIIQYLNGKEYAVAPPAYATRKAVWPRPTWDEIKKI